ncbi:CDF zinc transporter [Flagelloscypha sp. PMI_526]|nr:CDF zinc transporter [Flagelloscypha sp. PMI_526]
MKATTRLGVVLAISIAFFIGFRTKSLALIADAFHYLNCIVDQAVLAYRDNYSAIAFVASYTSRYTYAFSRAELVGAFFNGVFLLALGLSICLQAIERFVHIQVIDQPMLVLIVGSVGLFLNIVCALFVHEHHHDHDVPSRPSLVDLADVSSVDHHKEHNHTKAAVNPETIGHSHANLGMLGVLIHLLGDAVNNVGVIISAVIIWTVDSPARFYADPAASLLIGIIIFAGAIPLSKKCGHILLEAAPTHIDMKGVKADLLSHPEVESIHDLHVWHLSQSVILASLHVCVSERVTSLTQWAETEERLQQCFAGYGVNHVTISPELSSHGSPQPSSVIGNCKMDSDCKKADFGCNVGSVKKRVCHNV